MKTYLCSKTDLLTHQSKAIFLNTHPSSAKALRPHGSLLDRGAGTVTRPASGVMLSLRGRLVTGSALSWQSLRYTPSPISSHYSSDYFPYFRKSENEILSKSGFEGASEAVRCRNREVSHRSLTAPAASVLAQRNELGWHPAPASPEQVPCSSTDLPRPGPPCEQEKQIRITRASSRSAPA